MAAQAGLSLTWPKTPKTGFPRDEAHLLLPHLPYITQPHYPDTRAAILNEEQIVNDFGM